MVYAKARHPPIAFISHGGTEQAGRTRNCAGMGEFLVTREALTRARVCGVNAFRNT